MSVQDSQDRPTYPSNLTDAQWKTIDLLIPLEKDLGRHRSTKLREVVNGINYRWSSGCVWRMLPHDFPPWAIVYTYFCRWQHDGTLKELRDLLISCRSSPRAEDDHRTLSADPAPTLNGPVSHEQLKRNPDRLLVSDQHPVRCV